MTRLPRVNPPAAVVPCRLPRVTRRPHGRCVVLRLRPGADASALSATIVLASAPGAFSAVSPKIADDAEARMLAAEGFRLDAVDALRAVLVRNGDTAPLKDLLSAIDSAVPSTLPGAEGGVEALRHTIDSEALLGCKVENYGRWGSHYMRSLALSLRAQRRSNFRDQALQVLIKSSSDFAEIPRS